MLTNMAFLKYACEYERGCLGICFAGYIYTIIVSIDAHIVLNNGANHTQHKARVWDGARVRMASKRAAVVNPGHRAPGFHGNCIRLVSQV